VNTSSAVNPGVDINRPSISTISLERNYSRTMPNQAWVGLPSSWFNVSSQFRAVKLDTEVVVGPDALLAKAPPELTRADSAVASRIVRCRRPSETG
jgi:hypothetical protein